MTENNRQLIETQFKNNRKGFYTWLFNNKNRSYLVEELRELFPEASSDLERVYWLVFDLKGAPICPTCGKEIPFCGGKARNKNGYNSHCCHKCGTVDPHHQAAIKETKLIRYGDQNWNNSEKATATCKQKYGGNGIRGDRDKAKRTMLERYGVEYYTASAELNEMRNNEEIQTKIQITKRNNHTFNTSKSEEDYYKYLCNLYGKSDIVRQYKDLVRYPFNCDFYIKSKDLFIELNLFPTHGKEPFDLNNKEHLEYLERCKISPANWVEEQLPLIWAGTDVLKYQMAQQNSLNYLRFYTLEAAYREESYSKY